MTENIIPEHIKYLGILNNFWILYCNEKYNIQIWPKKVKYYFYLKDVFHEISHIK